MKHLLVAASCSLLLGGCITPLPDLTQSRSPCRDQPGGWCDFVQDAAREAYPYAMLSTNAYLDEDQYDQLPAGFEQRAEIANDNSGLAYLVFDHFGSGGGTRGALLARVIAFRGTDTGSTSDLFSGSLGERQRDGARAVYARERALLNGEGHPTVPIVVTGHSLGGALATQISIEQSGVRAYVLNTSPFFAGDPMMNDTNRLAISERGEFLRLLRRYKTAPAAQEIVINCNPSSNAASKHSIRALSDCLMWIAAYSNAEAHDLLGKDNEPVTKPEVECGPADKVHPGPVQASSEPCVHAPRPATKTPR